MTNTVNTNTNIEKAGFFHPQRRPYRFTVLLIAAALSFGSYFAYDSLGAIAPEMFKALNWDRSAISTSYSMYSVAAICTVFIGGILIDRLGTRLASLLFSGLIFLGSVIVAHSSSLWTLYIGRFIFGAGSESLFVAQNAILARWFKGKELALAFGLALTVSRLGTLFTFNTEALIAKYFGSFRYALWAAVIFCAFSWLCNVIYIFLDRHGEKVMDLPNAEAGDRIVLGDIKKFGASYWYVTLLCVTFYSAVFPFTGLSTDFFHDKWGIPLTPEGEGGFLAQALASFRHMFSTAGGITSIPVFASMCLAPFAGHMVDRIGRRGTLMVIGSLMFIPAHMMMGLTSINPIYPMVLLGAAFVLVPAAMWPAVPLIVEKERVGTAYGLLTMIQNVGLWFFHTMNGFLRDKTKSYSASQIMFSLLGLAGLISSLLLLRADRRTGHILEKSEQKRQEAIKTEHNNSNPENSLAL